MRVRNITGVIQLDSPSGVVLPPTPLGEWVDLPPEVALRLWRLRKVEVLDINDSEKLLWREEDGTHIMWMSPFSLADGYATAAEALVLALLENGLRVHVASCWFASTYGLQAKTVNLLQEPLGGPYKVGVCMATPGEFAKLPTPYKIGFTMYESNDPLHNLPEWRHECNAVDELFVPSKYCREVFGRFVRRKITVVPLAVSPYYYLAQKKRPKAKFVFGIHGTLTGRKSPLEAIDAFTKAFPTQDDVELQVKTRLGIVGYGQNYIPPIRDKRVKVINEDWLPSRVRGWLSEQVDVYIFPTKGEGFGMPPREAIVTGCPTIFTNCTGLQDIANEQYYWPIPVKKTEPSPLGGNWCIPDWDYLIEAMRWTYQNREKAYEKGYQGARWYIDNFGADAIAQHFIGVINGIDPDAKQNEVVHPAETIDNGAERFHTVFYEAIRERVGAGSTVIDVGVGEGVLYARLCQMGYNVIGVVEPTKMEAVRSNLEKHHLTANLVPGKLWEIDKLGLRAEACISQGVLADYSWHEVRRIIWAMLQTAPVVLCSIPTVNYPGSFSAKAFLRRREYWEDALSEFKKEVRYYGDGHRYLLIRPESIGFQGEYHGRIMDGTWRPTIKMQA